MCKSNPFSLRHDHVQTSYSSQHIASPFSTPPAPVQHTRGDPAWSVSCKAVTRKQEHLAGIVLYCQDAEEGIGAAMIICLSVLSFARDRILIPTGLLVLGIKNVLLNRACWIIQSYLLLVVHFKRHTQFKLYQL